MKTVAGCIQGEIMPKDWAKYVKPFCWLILPVLSDDYYDQRRRYSVWINALRADYGFNSSEVVILDNIVGPPLKDTMDDMVGGQARKFFTGKGLIEDIIHSIEDNEAVGEFMDNAFTFQTMKKEQQIALLREIYSGR